MRTSQLSSLHPVAATDGYTFEEHRHRFAAWSASTAASVFGCRFTVMQGRKILEAVRFPALAELNALPSPEEFDTMHRLWRRAVIEAAGPIEMSHGVAAKLINCYLKITVVLADQARAVSDLRIGAIHPPIDSLLLEAAWRKYPEHRATLTAAPWSRFTSDQYEAVVGALREIAADQPFWTIEDLWCGYR